MQKSDENQNMESKNPESNRVVIILIDRTIVVSGTYINVKHVHVTCNRQTHFLFIGHTVIGGLT